MVTLPVTSGLDRSLALTSVTSDTHFHAIGLVAGDIVGAHLGETVGGALAVYPATGVVVVGASCVCDIGVGGWKGEGGGCDGEDGGDGAWEMHFVGCTGV